MLSHLRLSAVTCDFSSSTLPGLSKLTALHSLEIITAFRGIRQTAFQPHAKHRLQLGVLAGVTSLQRLYLHDLCLWEGGEQQLARTPSLLQLTELSVVWPDISSCPAAALQALLYSSSALQEVIMPGLWAEDAGFWQQMFPTGSRVASITSLGLSGASYPKLATADLRHLAACCPYLQKLEIASSLSAAAQLVPLQRLRSLTSLTIDAKSRSRITELAQLGKLTQLVELKVQTLSRSAAWHLVQLTALTQLTLLSITVDDAIHTQQDGIPLRRPQTVHEYMLYIQPDVQPVVKLFKALQNMFETRDVFSNDDQVLIRSTVSDCRIR